MTSQKGARKKVSEQFFFSRVCAAAEVNWMIGLLHIFVRTPERPESMVRRERRWPKEVPVMMISMVSCSLGIPEDTGPGKKKTFFPVAFASQSCYIIGYIVKLEPKRMY